jgi:hypothetical protein
VRAQQYLRGAVPQRHHLAETARVYQIRFSLPAISSAFGLLGTVPMSCLISNSNDQTTTYIYRYMGADSLQAAGK